MDTGIKACLLNRATGEYALPDRIPSMTSEAFCNGIRYIAEEAHFGGVTVKAEEPGLSPEYSFESSIINGLSRSKKTPYCLVGSSCLILAWQVTLPPMTSRTARQLRA
jgi:hypothetical protein